jgi:glutaredoxin
MEIIAYTTPGCFYCDQLKELFRRADVKAWEEVVCTNKETLIRDYPDANAYPWIVIDGKPIGGLVETARYFLEIGIVSSKKSERS